MKLGHQHSISRAPIVRPVKQLCTAHQKFCKSMKRTDSHARLAAPLAGRARVRTTRPTRPASGAAKRRRACASATIPAAMDDGKEVEKGGCHQVPAPPAWIRSVAPVPMARTPRSRRFSWWTSRTQDATLSGTAVYCHAMMRRSAGSCVLSEMCLAAEPKAACVLSPSSARSSSWPLRSHSWPNLYITPRQLNGTVEHERPESVGFSGVA